MTATMHVRLPPTDADPVKQLERALTRRTVARRALTETLLLLEVAERTEPTTVADLHARCAAEVEALREAERDVHRIVGR